MATSSDPSTLQPDVGLLQVPGSHIPPLVLLATSLVLTSAVLSEGREGPGLRQLGQGLGNSDSNPQETFYHGALAPEETGKMIMFLRREERAPSFPGQDGK